MGALWTQEVSLTHLIQMAFVWTLQNALNYQFEFMVPGGSWSSCFSF